MLSLVSSWNWPRSPLLPSGCSWPLSSPELILGAGAAGGSRAAELCPRVATGADAAGRLLDASGTRQMVVNKVQSEAEWLRQGAGAGATRASGSLVSPQGPLLVQHPRGTGCPGLRAARTCQTSCHVLGKPVKAEPCCPGLRRPSPSLASPAHLIEVQTPELHSAEFAEPRPLGLGPRLCWAHCLHTREKAVRGPTGESRGGGTLVSRAGHRPHGLLVPPGTARWTSELQGLVHDRPAGVREGQLRPPWASVYLSQSAVHVGPEVLLPLGARDGGEGPGGRPSPSRWPGRDTHPRK